MDRADMGHTAADAPAGGLDAPEMGAEADGFSGDASPLEDGATDSSDSRGDDASSVEDGAPTDMRQTAAADGATFVVPPVQPSATAMVVVAGENMNCALTTQGQVRCWGSNVDTFDSLGYPGPVPLQRVSHPIPVPGLGVGMSFLSGSTFFTCAADGRGVVSCWGSFFRMVDAGPLGYQDYPVTPISGWGTTTSLSVGDGHACAATADGGAECFGGNTHGEVGDDSAFARLVPVGATVVPAGFKQIVAGGNSTCAITSGDGLACIGRNDHGQLGDGSTVDRWSPVTPVGMEANVRSVSLSGVNTCAVKTDGSVYCWGATGIFSVLGYLADAGGADITQPIRVDGVPPAAAVRVGQKRACAVLQTGELYGWGDMSIDPNAYLLHGPELLSGFAAVNDVAIGDHHICVLGSGGDVQCEGDNSHGQLGDGTYGSSNAPVHVLSLP